MAFMLKTGLTLKRFGHFESSWSRLGVVLGPSWGHLGAVLGPLGAVLGLPWGLLGPSWGHLGHLKMRKLRNMSYYKIPVNYRSDWPSGGPREGQVGVKMRSGGVLEPSWRQLGGNLAEDGQQDEAKLT